MFQNFFKIFRKSLPKSLHKFLQNNQRNFSKNKFEVFCPGNAGQIKIFQKILKIICKKLTNNIIILLLTNYSKINSPKYFYKSQKMRKYEVFQNFHIACSINSTFDINAAIINTLLKIVGLLISKFHFQRNFLTKAFNFSAQIFHIFLIFLYILHHFPQIFDEIFYFYAQIFIFCSFLKFYIIFLKFLP